MCEALNWGLGSLGETRGMQRNGRPRPGLHLRRGSSKTKTKEHQSSALMGSTEDRIIMMRMVAEGFLEEAERILELDSQKWREFEDTELV